MISNIKYTEEMTHVSGTKCEWWNKEIKSFVTTHCYKLQRWNVYKNLLTYYLQRIRNITLNTLLDNSKNVGHTNEQNVFHFKMPEIFNHGNINYDNLNKLYSKRN